MLSSNKKNKTTIIVDRDNLNVRKGPGYDYGVIRTCKPKEYELKSIQGNWGEIARNEWVCLDFVTIKKEEPKEDVKEDIVMEAEEDEQSD